jgi:hypothetical protein
MFITPVLAINSTCQLTRDIDSHVASQVLIFIFTLEIGFTGVDVSFISIVAVVLHFIIGHGITSFVGCYVAGCNPLFLYKYTASMDRNNVSRLAVRWQVKTTNTLGRGLSFERECPEISMTVS